MSPPKVSIFGSIKLVAWAMLGIRSNKGYSEDLAKVNPLARGLGGVGQRGRFGRRIGRAGKLGCCKVKTCVAEKTVLTVMEMNWNLEGMKSK